MFGGPAVAEDTPSPHPRDVRGHRRGDQSRHRGGGGRSGQGGAVKTDSHQTDIVVKVTPGGDESVMVSNVHQTTHLLSQSGATSSSKAEA